MLLPIINSLISAIILASALELVIYDSTRLVQGIYSVAIFTLLNFLYLGRKRLKKIVVSKKSSKKDTKSKFRYIYFLILPVLLIPSIFATLTFLESTPFRHVFIGFSSLIYAFMIYYFIRLVENPDFILGKKDTRKYSLGEVVLTYIAFTSFACLFGLYLYLGWSFWIFSLISIILNIFIFLSFFWLNNKLTKKSIVYTLVFVMVFIELAWALSFWPTGLLARSIILFLLWYVFIGFLKHYLVDALSLKIVRDYLVVSIITAALVLGTSQWTYM